MGEQWKADEEVGLGLDHHRDRRGVDRHSERGQ
jgi:hypothetical protein